MSRKALGFDTHPRIWNSRYKQIHFRLMDTNCLIYLAVIGLLVIFFHKTISEWPLFVLFHVGSIIIILELIRAAEFHPQKRILWILRSFYPFIIIMLGWRELDFFLPMFSDDYWFTDIAIYFDKSIFGGHPTVWAQQFYRPWLNEIMNIFYSGYYLCIFLVPSVLFIKGKREHTLTAFSIITFTYFTNYLLFYIVPTTGPHIAESLQDLHIIEYQGFFVSKITRILLANGSVRGGAFPSSHNAAMLVWSLIAIRYLKKWGYVLMPSTFGVAVSAVYLGYHHVTDVIGGLILGILCYFLALWLIKLRREDPIIHSMHNSHKTGFIIK